MKKFNVLYECEFSGLIDDDDIYADSAFDAKRRFLNRGGFAGCSKNIVSIVQTCELEHVRKG